MLFTLIQRSAVHVDQHSHFLWLLIGILTLAGCATSRSPDTYQRYQTMRAQEVQFGLVDSVRMVKIEGQDTGIGTTAGAVLGGLASSEVGQGRGTAAAIVAGAVIGGIVGNEIERSTTNKEALEITVRLDGEPLRMISVVQEGLLNDFRPGDRIRVLSDGRTTRVIHDF